MGFGKNEEGEGKRRPNAMGTNSAVSSDVRLRRRQGPSFFANPPLSRRPSSASWVTRWTSALGSGRRSVRRSQGGNRKGFLAQKIGSKMAPFDTMIWAHRLAVAPKGNSLISGGYQWAQK